MTDNEITELAWNLFKDVAKGITFPKTVEMVELKDGTVSFILFIQSGSGRGMMTFKPNIELIKGAIEVSEKGMSGITEKFEHSEYIIQESRETFARALIHGFMKTFHSEINDAISNSFRVPALVLSEMAMGELDGLDTGIEKGKRRKQGEKSAFTALDNYFARQIKSKKERLLNEFINADKSPIAPKLMIAVFYEEFLPEWEKAKACYKSNKIYPNWQQMVCVAFPRLPEELIARMGDADPYLATPSAIALEHAARCCGFGEDIHSIRSLQNYLKESRQWMKSFDEKEIDKFKTDYVLQAAGILKEEIKSAILWEKELDYDDLPYVVRVFAKEIWEGIKNSADSEESSENEQK